MKVVNEYSTQLMLRRFMLALFIAAGAGLAACDFNEGPAEETGEEIDQAAEETEEQMEEMGEEMQDSTNGSQ